MADLVGVYAASHAPLIARAWDTMPEAPRSFLDDGYRALAQRIEAARPDVLVMISPDHWANFFIDNLPAVCIGIGEEHDGPPEPFMQKAYGRTRFDGHPAFGRHLLDTALAGDFDPALSYRMKLDHGFCIPLWRMGIEPLPAILPIAVNSLEEPMPTVKRCLAWGRILRQAIETYPEPLRVAVLASGGLSHSIGEPTMGWIDEAFDQLCIALFDTASDDQMIAALEDGLGKTGNGGHEMRNWVIAHAAAGGQGFELIGYAPVPEIYVGCGFAAWSPAP